MFSVDTNFSRTAAPEWLISAASARSKNPAPCRENLYRPTKAGFLLVYRRQLVKRALWKNKSMCDRFLERVQLTLTSHHNIWAIDNIHVIRSYQEVTGNQIKPTLADLRKLQDGSATTPHKFLLNHFRWPRVVEFAEWLIAGGHTVQITTSQKNAESVDGKPFSANDAQTKGSAAFIINRLYEHFLLEKTDFGTDAAHECEGE